MRAPRWRRSDSMKNLSLVSAVLLLVGASCIAAAPASMYRYTTAEGNRVFSYTLPPEQARRGYEMVDLATGRVVTVAPELPPEELAAQLRRDQALVECQAELQRLNALYSSEREIGDARAVTLDALERRVAQIDDNIRLAERELEHLQSQAANAERAGRRVAEELVQTIQRRQIQIEVLRQEVAQRRDEQTQAGTRFARELERFRDGTCPESDVGVAARR
jgi:hypothetical protein